MIWVFRVVVFFFKQKTAYEMRISDWSSDVCSSDLMVVREDHCRRIEPQRLLDHFTRIHRCTVYGAVEHLPILDQPMARIQKQHCKDFMLEACQLVAQVLFDQQIGRASCRARVCPYV